MLKKILSNKIVLLVLIVLPVAIYSQTISGKVTSEGNPVVGASVIAKPTKVGTATDADGKFSLSLSAGEYTLQVSSVGYTSKSVFVKLGDMDDKVVNISLSVEAKQMQEVVVLGSRAQERVVIDSPLPIDVIALKEINSTGQTTFDKVLQYRVPSFNVVQTPVNDATALIDPYEIRNMGVSRTLILINGKRKNTSALVYTQTSPSRGESGVDISAIPVDAIKRLEVLRDGASAQYGSDAIAGVVNIVLKDATDGGSLTVNSGMTGAGDGKRLGISLNNGSAIGDNTGFINYTIDLSRVGEARRSGKVDAKAEADPNLGFGVDVSEVNAFLAKVGDDAGNRNSSPATSAAKVLINAGMNLPGNTELYGNATYTVKKVFSYANYRTPYWRPLSSFPYLKDFFGDGTNASYVGYVPTFEGDLIDYGSTIGLKTKKLGWNIDASFTTGFNSIDYLVNESHNRSGDTSETGAHLYMENSPMSFRPGGTTFSNQIGNVDASKAVSEKLSIAFGTEFRTENFSVIEGDKASWYGPGADSYAGNRPENSGSWSRFNFGGYFDASYDVTKNFLVAGTFRQEFYSDFGDATVYKVSSRLKTMNDKVTLRGSYSTGFKAPSLHQIYTQRSQYSFQPGGAIQVIGLINNVSPQARILGVKKLTPENSVNLTVGVGATLTDNFNFTVDYYDIAVSDRIVISNRVNTSSGSAEFFTNSISTKTSGIDVVANYNNIDFANGIVGLNFAGNVNLVNEKDGDILTVKGTPVIDESQMSLFFTSRPKQKFIGGVTYQKGNYNVTLNNTYFGETEFNQAGMDANIKTVFEAKVVSDLNLDYALDDNFSVNVSLNNILDVTPKWNFVAENAAGEALLANPTSVWEQTNLITFNGRYDMMTYDGFHFSQLGRMFNVGFTYKF